MKEINVGLKPILTNINLPTVIKTSIFPGDINESLFIATQVGEIFCLRNGILDTFLDIRQKIIKLGSNGGYDERGLLGLAFHPNFYYNGLFYLYYSLNGSQGSGALSESFTPNPCNLETLNLKWENRENNYDHIDTVEEWAINSNYMPHKRRTLLNIRRPFSNHNGVNSLIFSPESGKLLLSIGDGGSGYDPFNLSQDIMEIAGKIIEMDVDVNKFLDNPLVATRFNELPPEIYNNLSVIAKGVRNITGISFREYYGNYIIYTGIVGQDLTEAVFSFTHYSPIPVAKIIQNSLLSTESNEKGLINFGWRGWEGNLPTTIIRNCSDNLALNEKIIAFYNEAVAVWPSLLKPFTCYYHMDTRRDKFEGIAITGVQPYLGSEIPDLKGAVLFTGFIGLLAYSRAENFCGINDYGIINTDNFETRSNYYTCLGNNHTHTKLYLGAYDSANVTDFNRGTVFEIV